MRKHNYGTRIMTFDIKAPLLHDMVGLHGKWYPNKPALIDEEKTLSWKQLDDNTNRVANGLAEMGIKPGDAVAVLMTNSVEYVEIMYGTLRAGAIIVPLNLAVSEEHLSTMINDAAVKAIFYTPDQEQKIGYIKQHYANLSTTFSYGESNHKDSLDYPTWRDQQKIADPGIEVDDEAPCNIIYSSGTTGQPKGIKHTHRRRIQSMYELSLAHRYHFNATSICSIGLYSNIAWASLFCALIVGGTCVIQKRFKPEEWLATVKEHQVTHTMMVPVMFQHILDDPSFTPASVSSMEAIISGGSSLYAELKQKVTESFSAAVIEIYGLTEGFMTSLQPEEAEGRLSSVGKPIRGHDYIIIDDDDNKLPWGNTGEICVRSIHWMIEYHNRPEATEECSYIDTKGLQWLRTGDIGKVDEDGYLFIVDRKKDMVLSGGQNIYPADIEAVMITHPAISEVAVIGIPHEKWGETPYALVVPVAGGDIPSAQELTEWTNQNVGKRQRIQALEYRDNLPRNPNGKVLKRELKKEFS